MSKLRGGEWIPARVTGSNPTSPMVHIEVDGQTKQVNQTKLRKNPDMWHDVVIPGMDRRNGKPTVPQAIPINGDAENHRARREEPKVPVVTKRLTHKQTYPPKEEPPKQEETGVDQEHLELAEEIKSPVCLH